MNSFHPLRPIVLSFVLTSIFQLSFAQDQRIADSLQLIYESGTIADSLQLQLLRELAFNELQNLDRGLGYADELVKLSQEKGDLIYLYRGYLQKGRISRLKGNLTVAMTALFNSVKAAQEANYPEGVGGAYITIADIYSANGNSNNAILYYNKAIEILRTTPDSITLATAFSNAGDEYFNKKAYDSALYYFDESGRIFQQTNYRIGTAYNLGNKGMVYAELGRNDLAETNINEAIAILQELQDFYPIAVYLTYMSDIYLSKKDNTTALKYAQRSLELAKGYGLKEQISNANLLLSKLYEQFGNASESLKYYKDYVTYRDSVRNIEAVQQLANQRTDFEVAQKQIEVDLQTRNRQIIVVAATIALFLISLLAFGLYRRYLFIRTTNKIIEEERERSERLLLNILPEQTARELKERGVVQAKKFESVTVLFTDFKDFTRSAEFIEPELLVKSIDYYFKAFDQITLRHGLEKIKTIGDAYMCACGLPDNNNNHCRNTILAAREMINVVNQKLQAKDDLVHFEVRIGVHTGPVVAGIVGDTKWQYDIWGDTVNIASRMETNSVPGRINLSETTYQQIKDEFPCEYRGIIEVKHRSPLKMYFLS